MPEPTNPQPVLTDDEISKLKAEHQGKRLRMLKACGYTVVVRPPETEEWERFQRDAMEPARRAGATERLFRDCCIWPDVKAVGVMLGRMPGLSESFSNDVVELAGLTKNIEKKDL